MMDSKVAALQSVTQETGSVTTPSPDANSGRQLLMQEQNMGRETVATGWKSVVEEAHVGGSQERQSRGKCKDRIRTTEEEEAGWRELKVMESQ